MPFTEEQQRAVTGFLVLATMPNVSRNAGRITTGEFCPDVLPEEQRYDPETNPEGARAATSSSTPSTCSGATPRPASRGVPSTTWGVQYGLEALNAGVITAEQFLDLNARVGGFDGDGNFQAERTVADPEALRAVYESGRVTHGGGGLAETPIIDYRAYSDDRDNGDVHVRYHSFSLRDRLERANGRADNHVMLVEDDRYGLYSTASPVAQEALRQMDEWLGALTADESSAPALDRIASARPADLVDACWSRDDDPVKIAEPMVRGSGRCEELYPSAPRAARGGRRADRQRRPQVPAQAGRPRRLRRDPDGRAAGDARAGLLDRRLRLVAARVSARPPRRTPGSASAARAPGSDGRGAGGPDGDVRSADVPDGDGRAAGPPDGDGRGAGPPNGDGCSVQRDGCGAGPPNDDG